MFTPEPEVTPHDGASYGPASGNRWFGLWDAFFASSYLITVWLLLTWGSGRQLPIAVSVGALTLAIVWYAALGRDLIVRSVSGPRNLVFAIGLLVLFAVGSMFSLAGSFALFAVIPMLIMSLPMPSAAVLVIVANMWPVCVVWVDSDLGMSPHDALPLALVNITLSLLLGLWISRVVRQSKDRGHLIETLRRSRERVARLSHEAGVAAERERLAREIHDTLAQGLSGVINLLQATESELDDRPEAARRHLALAGQVAVEALAEARDFIADLTPAGLRENSLAQAVRRQADGLMTLTGLDVRCTIVGQERTLPIRISVVLLRCVQEAFANIRKHATGARTVAVSLTFSGDSVRLAIQDDGEGLSTDYHNDDDSGYGLPGMRARAEEVHGVAVISSRPGTGTSVEVTVPLPPASEEPTDGRDEADQGVAGR